MPLRSLWSATMLCLVAACAAPEAKLDRPETPVEDYWTLVETAEPAYPEQGQGEAGYVLTQVLIDRRGRIDRIAVIEAAPDERFLPAVLAALSSFRFQPTQANPDRHPMVTQLRFEFAPQE